MAVYQQEPASGSGQLARSLLILGLGLALTFLGAYQVSQVPQTRSELIADLRDNQAVIEDLSGQVEEANRQAEAVIASLTNVRTGIEALTVNQTVDEKTKFMLLGTLTDASAKLEALKSGSQEMLKTHEQTFLPDTLSLISKAEAATKKRLPPATQPDPWYLRPANRLYVFGIIGLAIGGILLALHAMTSDDAKRKWYEKAMANVGTFLSGLWTGSVLLS
ncbi:hypothetical protein [Mesorhizobium loti]|uniref:hypothetical protein n=1 Tax=Rhizobium loti TaxID=381 RepID=UPI0003FC611E|nr:hypothetical protein [Mesorhizobium loti]